MLIQIDVEVGGGGGGGGTGAFTVEVFLGITLGLKGDDNLKFFVMDNASEQNPIVSSITTLPIGAEIEFIKQGTGPTIRFTATPPMVIRSRGGLIKIDARYSTATLKKVAVDEWRLIGDLV